MTRITIEDPLINWTPGQHVFLSCHTIAPLQSHPFTISSNKSDGKLEFLVRAQSGGTKRFSNFANKHYRQSLPTTVIPQSGTATVFIEGPYGKMRDLRQFDSVVLIAGGSGATFTTPLLQDIVQSWESVDMSTGWRAAKYNNVRRIRFIWIIKSRDHLCWFQDQLQRALRDINSKIINKRGRGIELMISVYTTCDTNLTEKEATRQILNTGDNKESMHAEAEETNSEKSMDARFKKGLEEKVEVMSVKSVSSLSTSSNPDASCGPNGTCCCTSTVDEAASALLPCTCNCPPSSVPKPTSSSTPPPPQNPPSTTISTPLTTHPSEKQPPQEETLPASMRFLTGRPNTRDIIRKVLEEARGESAVVVCGPHGLRDNVRRDVVYLSDERAVHKGTGAQGIWLHTEGFEY